MSSELLMLHATAAGIALTHTFVGVDHYLPFVVMGRAQQWKPRKVMWVTFLCGVGHVLGSVLLGLLGVALGWALGSLTWFEGLRGSLAAWLLIGFGLAYASWAVVRLVKNKPHTHTHVHADGTTHTHVHTHTDNEHAHAHGQRRTVTFWSLFIVFVLGPCEALIPLLMFPAAAHAWWAIISVTFVFGVVTVATMMVLTLVAYAGLKLPIFAKVERYSHVLAGMAIALSGLGIQLLGI